MSQENNYSIAFDARPLYRHRDGISTFTEQTILAASKLYPWCTFIGVIFKGDDTSKCLIKELPSNIKIIKLPFSWRIYRGLAEIGIWLPIDKYINAKIRAFIYFNFVALPWVSDSIPKSLMIHDATFLKYPETLTRKNLKYLNKFVAKSIHKKGVESYTLSNHSANLLSQLMGIKFLVASPGASPFNQQITNKKSDCSILFIGTLEPRKNLLNLIEAYTKLDKEVQLKHSLIIAGRTGWGDDDIAKKVKINSNIVIVESPTDKEVEELYSNAACLVMPSIFEGFGIPVLDAVNYGLPVITSKDSPMEEILGKNGAIYINPLDIDSIKDGMNKFFKYDKSDIAEMLKISKQNSSKYSWNKTAEILFGKYL